MIGNTNVHMAADYTYYGLTSKFIKMFLTYSIMANNLIFSALKPGPCLNLHIGKVVRFSPIKWP